MDKKFIILYGYGYSGSGAVLDLLKEFDNVEINRSFFSIVKEPYGIIDLEYALTDNWEQIKSATAIKDYLWLCKKCEKPSSNYFLPAGLNLRETLNENFYQYSLDFISNMIDYDYYNWSEITDFKLNYIKSIYYRFVRILSRYNIVPQPKIDKIPFCSISHDRFQENVRNYINRLYEKYNDDKYIVIDHHPLPVQYGGLLHSYFGEKAKMIVVDRDPRSIYYDLVKHKNRVGLELAKSHNPEIYIKWHKALRKKLPQSSDILYLQFEDLIFDYENQLNRIMTFLNLEPEFHNNKRKYFNPDISIRNVDIWKTSNIGIPNVVFETINSILNGDSK